MQCIQVVGVKFILNQALFFTSELAHGLIMTETQPQEPGVTRQQQKTSSGYGGRCDQILLANLWALGSCTCLPFCTKNSIFPNPYEIAII
jgi:hypothetical protein